MSYYDAYHSTASTYGKSIHFCNSISVVVYESFFLSCVGQKILTELNIFILKVFFVDQSEVRVCTVCPYWARFGEFWLFYTEQVFTLPLQCYEKGNQGAQEFAHKSAKRAHLLLYLEQNLEKYLRVVKIYTTLFVKVIISSYISTYCTVHSRHSTSCACFYELLHS